MRTISSKTYAKLHPEHQLPVIDVRSAVEFKAAALPGSHNIPLDQLDENTLANYLADPPGTEPAVYLICKSGKRSQMASEKLASCGIQSICIEGGIDSLANDISLETSAATGMSLERQVRIAAGALVLTGLVLGSLLHPTGYLVAAFVGGGLVFAGVTDWCGMGLLLARMPWNKV